MAEITSKSKVSVEIAKTLKRGDAELTHLRVASVGKRFCAIGRAFYPEPTFIALADLKQAELEELEASPHLRTNYTVDPES